MLPLEILISLFNPSCRRELHVVWKDTADLYLMQNEDVMDLELEGVTNVDLEDVLVETEDENNMNVKDKEVFELEDEMAQEDKSSKEKDVFEKTAEVAKNVSEV